MKKEELIDGDSNQSQVHPAGALLPSYNTVIL